MASLAEVRKGALQLLGRANPFDTVDSTLDTDITNAYDELWAELERRQIVYWGADEAVPDEFVRPLKYLLAYFYMPNTAVSEERERRIVTVTGRDGEKGFHLLRRIAARTNVNQTVPGVYF